MSKENKDKSPAYQWYPRKVFGSQRVSLMSLAEEGAYRRALDYCWLHGSVPRDPKKLAFLIGKGCTERIAKGIIGMFLIHPDDETLLIHETIEREREKQKEYNAKQSENGKKGGRPKKETQNKPTAFDRVIENETQPEPNEKLCSLEFDTVVNTPLTPVGGTEEKFEIEKEILEHFGFNEQNNFRQCTTVHQACVALNHRGRLEYFTEQFRAYVKYRKANTSRTMWAGFSKFIGTGKEFFEDGKWAETNWVEALKEFNKTNGLTSGANVLPGNFLKR